MNTKTLDLRGLTDAQRNNAITDAISEAVCGWKKFTIEGHGNYFRDQNGVIRSKAFSTSADAVLPLLEKTGKDIIIVWSGGTWSVQINEDRDVGTENYNSVTIGDYDSPSLAQTACIALLRANGYEVLT